jgi:hypothetical protein
VPDRSLSLGVDLNLVNPDDASATIIRACVKCWFEKNGNHLYNRSDCSGFVKAVQSELRLRQFAGDANSIFDELETRPDWQILGLGTAALPAAGNAANHGALTIGVWKNPGPQKHGHVSIVTAYFKLLGVKPEQHAVGAWGQIHGVGQLLGKMSETFGKNKHHDIRYAKCLLPILF